jgi:hypothetical protein
VKNDDRSLIGESVSFDIFCKIGSLLEGIL